VLGLLLELSLFRQLYRRDHLSQVLATFALILIANEAVRVIWGPAPLLLNPPEALAGPVEFDLFGETFFYPAYRLLIIGVGLAVGILLYLLVAKSRVGMWVRAGAANREMTEALGINVRGCSPPSSSSAPRSAPWPAACSDRCWPCRSAWARAC
jgi:branched-chain amino acid transport system permease protein